MHGGHAHFSFEPLSVPASLTDSAPALEPLSPLSDLAPSPPLANTVQGTHTRLALGPAHRLSQRRRDVVEHSVAPPAPAQLIRRIRPLACTPSNINANTASPGANTQGLCREKVWKGDAWRTRAGAGGTQHQVVNDFPPTHVVLHPDDANNKVFLSMGRALMSANNCAMTIKDLAELSMRHGMVCQNVSAASQAITFFIRSHLHRCEEEQDFPLLLRHVLSGTQRDDALAPALYSRTGGNVSNKDKTARDENGNPKERITCFRRGTTVWYLSRAAGAPCPFARAGIALRDYAEASAITSVEGRKVDGDSSRGVKRKRERSLRKRAGSGPAARRDDEDESDEENKPPKIKLMLRLRPCLTSMREKTEADEEDSSDSSSSDSDTDAQDESMHVDAPVLPVAGTSEPSARKHEPTWTFPPFPIQRRISIPPYTPSEETYPTIYTSPTTNVSSSAFFSEWPVTAKPKLELACVDSPPRRNASGPENYCQRERYSSVPFSVASPPPDSDEEFGLDDDDDGSLSMSPEIRFKREDEFSYVWPRAAPLTSSLDVHIKIEPDVEDENEAGHSKRSSTQTVKHVKPEDLDLDIGSLSLSFGESSFSESQSFRLDTTVKQEDDGFANTNDVFSWGQSVDSPQDNLVGPGGDINSRPAVADDTAMQMLWKDVELLGPDTVGLQDLEDGGWDEGLTHHEIGVSQSPRRHSWSTLEQIDDDDQSDATPQSPEHIFSIPAFQPPNSPAFTLESSSSPPSLAGSVNAWSACSPDTEIDSIGPASPPSLASFESPSVMLNEEPSSLMQSDSCEVGHSSPWTIPGKQVFGPTLPSRQAVAVRSENVLGIPLSQESAPWERGMCTEEDVENHLLEPTQSLAMMSMKQAADADAPLEGALPAPEPPLSPQEEAIFQSLCICPDMPWEDEIKSLPALDMKRHESTKVLEMVASRSPDAIFAGVLAAARRPTMRLRERRPSKRLAEVEQLRKQAATSHAQTAEADANADNDTDSDSEVDATLPRRGKCDVSSKVAGKDGSNGSKGLLRRSKRVANAVATQRNRERLRRRTAT